MVDNNDWDRFARLGDMIGDGLHLEDDGKWIVKEYRSLQRRIFASDPHLSEAARELQQKKNKIVNDGMLKLLANNKCKCGGSLKQSRSGSKVAYCEVCNTRYKAGKNKNR